ncbi:hypothetical protein BD410DRAFT_781431 [Rickenella mellea]|uniref:HAD-like protein n=1 Tax=Rickenella mellea TaxID=50990 RepID=A0A4Y7QP70_9AGAM|nr:hypothetical protein BD410DRAFT_781431 [Rickenella mellea]
MFGCLPTEMIPRRLRRFMRTRSVAEPSRVIAVDLDDVLAQTNRAVAEWHNETHGTSMTLDDFHYYHYYKNPGWGTKKDTSEKVKEFYRTNIMKPIPVPGALEGVQELRRMGYTLVIVTARHEDEKPMTLDWVNKYFPDIFDDVKFTGAFREEVKEKGSLSDESEKDKEVGVDVRREDGKGMKTSQNGVKKDIKLSKAEVCAALNAPLLIDDSAENAIACARATPPMRVLLFGEYAWNERESKEWASNELSYETKLEMMGGKEWWKEEKVVLPKGVARVKDWDDVIHWVRQHWETR